MAKNQKTPGRFTPEGVLRREQDSNLRRAFALGRFSGDSLKPLSHLWKILNKNFPEIFCSLSI